MSDVKQDSDTRNVEDTRVCPRITYLSGKECTLTNCRNVVDIKLRLSTLNAWMPHEIMVLTEGKELLNKDPAPEKASVVWKESENADWRVWRDDLRLLA